MSIDPRLTDHHPEPSHDRYRAGPSRYGRIGGSYDPYVEPDQGSRRYDWRIHRRPKTAGSVATLSLLAAGAGLAYWAARQFGSFGEDAGDRSSRARALPRDETRDLIASSKVEGTAVYNRDGKKLGEVLSFMVGKRSGRVAYAVVQFGGMMGMGGRHYPVPWTALDYDTEKGGYVIDIDEAQLRNAPSHSPSEEPFSDEYGRRVSDYWVIVY